MGGLSDSQVLAILLRGMRAELSKKQKARKTVANLNALVTAAEQQKATEYRPLITNTTKG